MSNKKKSEEEVLMQDDFDVESMTDKEKKAKWEEIKKSKKKVSDMTTNEQIIFYEMRLRDYDEKVKSSKRKRDGLLKKAMDDRRKKEFEELKKFKLEHEHDIDELENLRKLKLDYEENSERINRLYELEDFCKNTTINHSVSNGSKISTKLMEWFLILNHPDEVDKELVDAFNS